MDFALQIATKRGRDAGMLSHIYIRNCFVHDVTGKVHWIGGNTAAVGTFQNGWDTAQRMRWHRCRGRVDEWHQDLVRRRRHREQRSPGVSFGGVVSKQLDGGYGWGVRASKTDSTFTPHTNITARGNYVSQTNTPYGCNAFYITGVKHGLIERNVSKDAGTSASRSTTPTT